MDCSGNVIVAPEYDDVRHFSEGLARVGLVEEYYDIWGIQSDGRYGFVDTSGTLVIPLEYDYVYDFSEGLARVLKKDKYGFIDASGILVVLANTMMPAILVKGWFALKLLINGALPAHSSFLSSMMMPVILARVGLR